MELMVELSENKYFTFLSPQVFLRLGAGSACRDGFARFDLVKKFSSLVVEKAELTYSVFCRLVIFPRPLWEGVNVLGWLVIIPRPLWERAEFQVERERNLEIRVRGQIHPNYCVILSPTSIRGRRISKTYFVILSPAFIQERRISKTLQERDSSGFRPQNDGTPGSLAFPRPLGERVEFQVERERNLEIRVRGFKTFTPHNPRRCA